MQKRGGAALHTHFQLDTAGTSLFTAYDNTSDDTLDITFNVKDLAVLVQLCKVLQADVVMHMSSSGNPLLAVAAWPNAEDSALSDCVAAELLLATMTESVQVWPRSCITLVYCAPVNEGRSDRMAHVFLTQHCFS